MRINDLNLSLIDAIIKIVDGNPGATTAVAEMSKVMTKVDPQSMLGEWGPVLSLDGLGIYGSRIWMLYKDVCKQNAGDTIGILRAYQLGIITKDQLNKAIDNYGEGINVKNVINAVKKELKEFNNEAGNKAGNNL